MGLFSEDFVQFTNLEGGPLLILPSAIVAINTYSKVDVEEESQGVVILTWGWAYAVRETLDEVLEKIGAAVRGAES